MMRPNVNQQYFSVVTPLPPPKVKVNKEAVFNWVPSCHLLHVPLGDELLQLGYLAHPVEDPPAGHVEDLGRGILRNTRKPV